MPMPLPGCCPYTLCFTDCAGTPDVGATVTLTKGMTTVFTGTTDSNGCVKATLPKGTYNWTLSAANNYMAASGTAVVACGSGGLSYTVCAASGFQVWGPAGPSPDGTLYLCTPYGEVTLSRESDGLCDPNNALASWTGTQDSPPYQFLCANGSTCTVTDSLFYRVQHFSANSCTTFVLTIAYNKYCGCGSPLTPGCSAPTGCYFMAGSPTTWSTYNGHAGDVYQGTAPANSGPYVNVSEKAFFVIGGNTAVDGSVSVNFNDSNWQALDQLAGDELDTYIWRAWQLALPANHTGVPTGNPAPLTLTLSSKAGQCATYGYGGYYGSGGTGLPATIRATFNSATFWGSQASQTYTLSYNPANDDYEAPCLTTNTDGGHCDPSGTTYGLLTVALSPAGTGLCNATAQWTGGTFNIAVCAAGSCSYYGAAQALGVPTNSTSTPLVFSLFQYSAGNVGNFAPGQTYSVVTTQNWDGSGSLPAGWTFNAAGGSSWTINTSPAFAALSGSNVLQITTNGSGEAHYSTADTTSGNVLVQSAFGVTGFTGSSATLNLIARGSSLTSNLSTATCYLAVLTLAATGGIAQINSVVSGTSTQLVGLTGLTFSHSAWYTAFLECDGSNISMSVRRESDGAWLGTGGAWQSSETPCLTIIDSSVTGSGDCGFFVSAAGADSTYLDNFVMTGISGTAGTATVNIQVP